MYMYIVSLYQTNASRGTFEADFKQMVLCNLEGGEVAMGGGGRAQGHVQGVVTQVRVRAQRLRVHLCVLAILARLLRPVLRLFPRNNV